MDFQDTQDLQVIAVTQVTLDIQGLLQQDKLSLQQQVVGLQLQMVVQQQL